MDTVSISARDFIKLITVLKPLIDTRKSAVFGSKRIQLNIENGLIVGYACNNVSVGRCKIPTSCFEGTSKINIDVPKLMPAVNDTVLLSWNDSKATISFGNVSFTYKQVSPGTDFESLFNRINKQYLERMEQQKEESIGSKMINETCLNEEYLYNIVSALHKLKIQRIKIGVDEEPTSAVRITADKESVEVYILPIRSNE